MPRERKPSARQKGERWYARIRLNDGTRHEWAIPVRAGDPPLTQTKAEAYAIAMQSEHIAGRWDPRNAVIADDSHGKVSSPATTVSQLLASWVRLQTHASSGEEARDARRNIEPAPIARMRVVDVRPVHVVEFLRWLAQRPSRRGGTLAPRTIRCAYSILRRAFDHAVLLELVSASPCVVPRSSMPAMNDKVPGARAGWVFSVDEVRALMDDARIEPPRRVAHALLFCAGLRVGELAALRWSDWDRSAKPLTGLHVARSMDRYGGGEKATKTGVVRRVPVHPHLHAVLAAWWQTGWQQTYGRAPNASDRIVPDGTPDRALTQVRMYRRFQRSLTTLGLRQRRVHDTRRTFISLLRDGGARQDVVAALTHTTRRTIIDAYSSLAWSTLCREMECLRLSDASVTVPPLNEHSANPLNGGSIGGSAGVESMDRQWLRGVAEPSRQETDSRHRSAPVEIRRETQGADEPKPTERNGSGEAFPHSSPDAGPSLRWGESAAFELLERVQLAALDDETLLRAALDGAVN